MTRGLILMLFDCLLRSEQSRFRIRLVLETREQEAWVVLDGGGLVPRCRDGAGRTASGASPLLRFHLTWRFPLPLYVPYASGVLSPSLSACINLKFLELRFILFKCIVLI